MHRVLTFVVVGLLPLASCGGSPVGRWVCDTAGVIAQTQNILTTARAGVPSDSQERLDDVLRPLDNRVRLANSVIEIRADGTCRFEPRSRNGALPVEGTWRLEGERITLTFTKLEDGAKLVITGRFDGDGLTIIEDVAAKDVHTHFRRADS